MTSLNALHIESQVYKGTAPSHNCARLVLYGRCKSIKAVAQDLNHLRSNYQDNNMVRRFSHLGLCGLGSIPVQQLLQRRHLARLGLQLVEARAHVVLIQVCGTCATSHATTSDLTLPEHLLVQENSDVDT